MEYKLMIVDGEESVRSTIAHTLPWKDWGYRVCAVCRNGEEALNLLDSADPDVVLSNIRMPVTEDMDLMQWLHRNRPRVRVVILSCYKDFEHLNLAIKNQVTDYLLKPLDPVAFQEVFRNLHRKIDGEKQNALDIQQSVEFHFEQWLRDLIRGTASREDTARFQETAVRRGIYLENCYLAALHPDGREGEEERSCRQFKEEARALFNESSLPVPFFCIISGEGEMGGIFSTPDKAPDPRQVAASARLLQQQVRQKLGGTVSMGISSRVTAMDQLGEAWQNARHCLRQSLLHGCETLMFYEDIRLAAPADIPYFSPETIEGFLLDGDYDGMQGEIERVFDSFSAEKNLEYRTIDHLVLSLLFTVDLWAIRYDIHMNEILRSLGTRYEDIHCCDSLTKKRDFLCSVLFAVQLQMKKQRNQSKKGSGLAWQVRELIEREYDKSEMSLDYIAYKLRKHPSYISKIFKKELNCNFNDYLNKLRIEKAEQLLLLPENKIYEIAGACGYVDTSHFNRVFRKYKGVSPTQYREEGTARLPDSNLAKKNQN